MRIDGQGPSPVFVICFSPAEIRLMGLIKEGLSDKDIAADLCRTVGGVQTSLGTLYRLLGLSASAGRRATGRAALQHLLWRRPEILASPHLGHAFPDTL